MTLSLLMLMCPFSALRVLGCAFQKVHNRSLDMLFEKIRGSVI